MSSVDTLLRQAVSTAQAGNKAEAQQLFMQVVELDEQNELAWLWLANLVEDPNDKRVCLENVLAINPQNEQATRALATIPTQPAPTSAPAPPPAPTPPPAPPAAAPPSELPSAPTTVVVPQNTEVPYKCPRCGEPATTTTQSRCTSCHSNLVVSDPPVAKTSFVVKLLGILWIIGGALPLLATLIFVLMMNYTMSNLADWVEYQQDPMAYAREHAAPNAEEPLNPADYEPGRLPESLYQIAEAFMTAQQMQESDPNAEQLLPENPFEIPFTVYLILLAPGLIVGGIKISIGLGIMKRKAWAYILNILELIWNIAGTVMAIVLGGVMMSIAISAAAEQGYEIPSDIMPRLEAFFAANAVIFAIPVIIQFLLTALGYSTFFGTRRYRFIPTDTPSQTDQEHYRRGSYYGKKGLWALAAHEWEMAIKLSSDNPNYHHALGLAYTELHEYKKAVGAFQKALGLGGNKRELQSLIEQTQQLEAGNIAG